MSSGSNIPPDGKFTLDILKYYQKERSAWDRVLMEDPLDPPEPERIPNFASTGAATIVVGANVATNATTPIQTHAEQYILPAIRYITNVGTGTGWDSNDPNPGTSTGGPNLNQPPPGYRQPLPNAAPWPRNGKDRRILKALGSKLWAAIQRAERAIGRRIDARSIEEWNNRFWDFISRPKPPKPVDRCRIK